MSPFHPSIPPFATFRELWYGCRSPSPSRDNFCVYSTAMLSPLKHPHDHIIPPQISSFQPLARTISPIKPVVTQRAKRVHMAGSRWSFQLTRPGARSEYRAKIFKDLAEPDDEVENLHKSMAQPKPGLGVYVCAPLWLPLAPGRVFEKSSSGGSIWEISNTMYIALNLRRLVHSADV